MNGWDAKIRQRNKEDTPSGSVEVDMPRMYATYFRLKSNEATRPRCTILSHNNFYYYFLIPKKNIYCSFFPSPPKWCVCEKSERRHFVLSQNIFVTFLYKEKTNK